MGFRLKDHCAVVKKAVANKSRFLFLLVSLTLILSGCGSSESENSNGQYNYLAMVSDGAIIAIDPLNPNLPRVIEAKENSPVGMVTVGSGPDTLVYGKQGHIYKVDLSPTSDLTPQQVSSESEANIICAVSGIAKQGSTPLYRYTLPGENGLCNDNPDASTANGANDPPVLLESDNLIRSIRLNMGIDEDPDEMGAIPYFVDFGGGARIADFVRYDSTVAMNPVVLGRLLIDQNANLIWYDQVDISNAIVVRQGVSEVENILQLDDRYLVRIDDQMYMYTPGVHDSLNQSIYTFESSSTRTAASLDPYQSGTAYFADGALLVEISFSDTQATFRVRYQHAEKIDSVSVTENYLGVTTSDVVGVLTLPGVITTINKSNGRVFSLADSVSLLPGTYSLLANDKIYYFSVGSTSEANAGIINADGTDHLPFPGSTMRFVGTINPTGTDSTSTESFYLIIVTPVSADRYQLSLHDRYSGEKVSNLGQVQISDQAYNFNAVRINAQQIVFMVFGPQESRYYFANVRGGQAAQILFSGVSRSRFITSAPTPTPQPAPTPTPQPAPMPTPQPAPTPTPQPAPGGGGSGGGIGGGGGGMTGGGGMGL